MKSVDDVVAELRLKVAKNLARDVCIVSIDCDDALALSQMAADFAVMLAEGKRALATLQRKADGMREALLAAHHAIVSLDEDVFGPILDGHGGHCGWVRDELLSNLRAALNGSPQVEAEKGSDR